MLLPVGDRQAGAWLLISTSLHRQAHPTTKWRKEKAKQSKTYCPLSLVTSTKTLILILGAGVGETPQERERLPLWSVPGLLQTLT